jgi:hypothetical protein
MTSKERKDEPHALELGELVGIAFVRRPRVGRRGGRAAEATKATTGAAAAHRRLHLSHLLGRRHWHAAKETAAGRAASGTAAEHVERVGTCCRSSAGGGSSASRRRCSAKGTRL